MSGRWDPKDSPWTLPAEEPELLRDVLDGKATPSASPPKGKRTRSDMPLPIQWRHALGESKLGTTPKVIGYAISAFMDEHGRANPGRVKIASYAGLSVRAVELHYGELIAAGLLKVTRSAGGQHRTNSYQALIPPENGEPRSLLSGNNGEPDDNNGEPHAHNGEPRSVGSREKKKEEVRSSMEVQTPALGSTSSTHKEDRT